MPQMAENGHSEPLVAYVFSDELLQLLNKFEKIQNRATMVHTLIKEFGFLDSMRIVPVRPATSKDLLQFHSADYLDHIELLSHSADEDKDHHENDIYGIGFDCPYMDSLLDFIQLVAGSSITAAEILMERRSSVAINWFGGWHHAFRSSASGFCYVNDIVLSILRLREVFDRVLYVDLDLHHGDAVEEAFNYTNKVMTVSFHKYSPGFFPGTGDVSENGTRKGKYYSVNVPLQDGIADDNFVGLFWRVMDTVLDVFPADAIVCQMGADGLCTDPHNSFNLTEKAYCHCVSYLLEKDRPLLLLGGGGYNFPDVARCWAAVTAKCLGMMMPEDITEHKYFDQYGPDFTTKIRNGNRLDQNSKEYLEDIFRAIFSNLQQVKLLESKI